MYQPWPWGTQCETTEKGGNQWVSTRAVVGQLFSRGGTKRPVKQCLALGRSLKTSKAKVTTQLSKFSDPTFLPRPHPLATNTHPLSQASPCGTSLHLIKLILSPPHPPTVVSLLLLGKEAPDGPQGLTQIHHLAANLFLAYPPVGFLQLHKRLVFCKQGVTM